ncbi:hypothetical protein JHK87_034092 [Glycine soja]|nr:hypothetical protein JHK87_034092 [Glycine soja]
MISANCCWLIDGEDVLEAREAWPKYWLIVTLVPATRTRPGCSGRPRAMFRKTTVCHSISQNFSASSLSYFDQVRTKLTPMEQAVKTSGMKIKSFKDEDTRISIWNIAGQHNFLSLHDLMFAGHGSASFFIIISSLFRKPCNKEQKSSTEIEEDLQYWLRFIVSNFKRAIQQIKFQ